MYILEESERGFQTPLLNQENVMGTFGKVMFCNKYQKSIPFAKVYIRS
jgi:hypothetical protein